MNGVYSRRENYPACINMLNLYFFSTPQYHVISSLKMVEGVWPEFLMFVAGSIERGMTDKLVDSKEEL